MLETLLYIGISAFVITVLMRSMLSVMDTREITTADTQTQQMARFVLQRITQEVSQATSITAGSSVFDSATGSLVLVVPHASQNPTTISMANGIAYIQQGAAAAQAITSDVVRVTKLQFTNLSTASTQAVRVVVTVENVTDSAKEILQDSVTLTGSIVIRLPQS